MAINTQLTLANLNSRYELLSLPVAAWSLQRELDRISREQLPQVLADYLLPQVDPHHSVLRVRSIDIELTVNREALRNGMLPRLWAKRIAQDLFRQIRFGNHDTIVQYADYAHFAAAFVVDLLHDRAWQAWQYQEFTAFRHLSVGQTITELLVSRPSYLPVIANILLKNRVLEQLFQVLQQHQCYRILEAQHKTHNIAYISGKRMASQLATMAGYLQLSLDNSHTVSQKHLLFLLQLSAVKAHESKQQASIQYQLSSHLALLQHALVKHPSLSSLLDRYLKQKGLATLSDLDRQVPGDLLLLLRQYGKTESGQSYLRHLLEIVKQVVPNIQGKQQTLRDLDSKGEPEDFVHHQDDNSHVESNVVLEKNEKDEQQTAGREIREFSSAVAGFTLLLMTLKDLNIPKRLSMGQIQFCLMQLMDEKFRRIYQLDPLWDTMFPGSDPKLPLETWHPVEEVFMKRLDPQQKNTALGLSESEAWSYLIYKSFANRLPGMGESSANYLCHQFFQRSGHVYISNKEIIVSLVAIPLGVVLRMSGFHGWQGMVPWLEERELNIEIPT